MQIEIPAEVLLLEPVVVGAAVRLAALSEVNGMNLHELRKASGLSPHRWEKCGDLVMECVTKIRATANA